MTEVRHKLLPKQDEMIFSKERHTVYSGAVGAGKSRALCLAALIHCAGRPTTRFGLFRKTLVGLRKSTLKTLIEGDGDAPPVLPYGSYSHNQVKCEIRLAGGGEIVYSGIEDPIAVRSMNLTQAGIDEVTELQYDDYNAVDDRVRVRIGKEPFRVISATNPGTPSHWMAKMMGLSPDKTTPDENCRIILTKTADNTFLDPEYIQSFDRHKGTLYYRRMFLGEWCGTDGLVYPQFSRDRHVQEIDTTGWEQELGVDDGVVHPFCTLDAYWGPDDRLHIAREVYEKGLASDQKRKAIKGVLNGDARVIVDSAAKDLILSLQQNGVRAVPCDKGQGSVLYGINLVQTMLANDMLTVDPCCTNVIREFETYEWAENRDGLKDEPRKMNDHAMDPIRYLARYRMEQRGLRVLGPDPDEVKKQEQPKSFAEMRADDPEWGW